MIRVELQGGLGNQLFIWAMAHHLAETYKNHIKLIVPLNKKNRIDRPCELYELDKLCQHNISISQVRWFSTFTKVIDKISKLGIVRNIGLMERLGIITQENAEDIYIAVSKPPKILRGYYQNQEIPYSTKSQIHHEIARYLEKVEIPEIVLSSTINQVVHIRRGDTKEISKEWGVLSLEYYEELVNDSKDVIICTDETSDRGSIQKKFSKSLVVTSQDSSAWQVLKIISLSQVFLMANSTLSWWGAWIAVNSRNTKVYFPEPWRPGNEKIGQSLKIRSSVLKPAIFESE
jgi:hypothetical protein